MFLNGRASRVTIVMYHYVRELAGSRYPAIKALELRDFKGQIDYCRKHYQFVSMAELLAAARGETRLPDQAMLLTFDDAYIDHFTAVFPVLSSLKIPASFFPPAQAILDHRVLDVNKIHFLLAARAGRESELLDEIWTRLNAFRDRFALKSVDEYRSFERLSRYDSFEIELIKRLLQADLPPAVRAEIAGDLFAEIVTADEESFARELYMSLDQLRCLAESGMYVGSHGYQHVWLDRLTPEEQGVEIQRSRDFLRLVGSDAEEWVMCYPYGVFNDSLVTLLRASSCRLALTTRVGIADIASDDPLMLPRLDTNDLPKRIDAIER